MKIGFVGLGAMGQGMARRLIEAGHTLAVHNRTVSRAEPLVAVGARLADSPADACRDCDLVISMLGDDDAVEAVSLGIDGISAGLQPGAIHVSCSTISVALSRRLADAHAANGQAYLAATVLGRPPAAASGTLFIVAAGARPEIDRAMPAFDALGQRTYVLGDDPASSNLLKLSLNFLIFSTIEQMAEVFALNDKGGTSPQTVLDILTSSFFNAPVHKNYGRLIVERAFDTPGAPMTLAAKDTKLLLEAGEALGVPMPMGSLVRDRLIASIARGDQDLDFAGLSRRAREDAGLPTD